VPKKDGVDPQMAGGERRGPGDFDIGVQGRGLAHPIGSAMTVSAAPSRRRRVVVPAQGENRLRLPAESQQRLLV
jgi:hypothetical protein